MAGQPVSAAGTITVKNGKITAIDTASGHYQPTPTFLKQAIESLVRQGADISNVTIGFGGNKATGSDRSKNSERWAKLTQYCYDVA